jgi:hypothetical protein
MATVDRDRLLLDTKTWLPSSHTLSDSMILALNETVILRVGDDDSKYPQIRCEALKACATKMMVDYPVTSTGLKRDRTGEFELEYYNTTGTNFWKDYVSTLMTDVCPLFGYSPTKDTTVGRSKSVPYIMSVYPVVDCSCPSDVLNDFTIK